jgi:hypothetical protein
MWKAIPGSLAPMRPSSPDTYKEYFEKIQIPAARKAGLIE